MKQKWFEWLENNREELEQKFLQDEEILQKFEAWTLDNYDASCY